MKKVIAIMLVLIMTFAFADGYKNSFGRTIVGGSANGWAFTGYNEDTGVGGRVPIEKIGVPYYLDTNNVLVKDVSLGRTGNFTISGESGDIIIFKAVYVEDGFDTTDYLLITNADSNGTVLSTSEILGSIQNL